MKLKTLYLVLCALGAALPLWQIAPWFASNGLNAPLMFRQLFADRVGAFFGMDVVVSAFVLAVFIFAEGKRVRRGWLALVATAAVGVSLGLPLFLYMRERELERRSAGSA